jgi:hypothetical protein
VHIALNVALLYAAWFATVIAAANGRPILAAAASLCVVLLNILVSPRRSDEVRVVIASALVGLAFDGAVINLDLATYASPGPVAYLPPFWLVTMWMAFATALNVSLAWLQRRLALAAALAAIGGPLSYYAGARLGGMAFSEPLWLPLGILALMWAATLPLLLLIARRLRAGA